MDKPEPIEMTAAEFCAALNGQCIANAMHTFAENTESGHAELLIALESGRTLRIIASSDTREWPGSFEVFDTSEGEITP